jgi:hypothetical protein
MLEGRGWRGVLFYLYFYGAAIRTGTEARLFDLAQNATRALPASGRPDPNAPT